MQRDLGGGGPDQVRHPARPSQDDLDSEGLPPMAAAEGEDVSPDAPPPQDEPGAEDGSGWQAALAQDPTRRAVFGQHNWWVCQVQSGQTFKCRKCCSCRSRCDCQWPAPVVEWVTA